MQRSAIVAAAVFLFATGSAIQAQASASVQAKPYFGGIWTRLEDSTVAPPTGRGGVAGLLGVLGTQATILQNEKTLTLSTTTQMGDLQNVYNLDGTESKGSISLGATGAVLETVSKARWDANKLVLLTSINLLGTPVETSMVLSLGSNGLLTVQASTPGAQGTPPATAKLVYKKS
jgi:hypothetical protein